MKKISFGFVVFIILFSNVSFCQKIADFKNFKWLIGIWHLESKTENSYEEWNLISDSLILGKSYSVNKKDTLVNEIISIIKVKEGVFYKAIVFNQNNGQAVYFKLTNFTKNSISFENKTHDFPKIINYTLFDEKNLTATIEADTIKYMFKMKKIK